MNNVLDSVLNWFVNSSVDPNEYSLTLKALLMTGAGSIVAGLQGLGLNFSVAQYTTDVGHAVAVVGLLLTVFGLARKIFVSTATLVSKAN